MFKSYNKYFKIILLTLIISTCIFNISCNNKSQKNSNPNESLLLFVGSSSERGIGDLYVNYLGMEKEKISSYVKENSFISYSNGDVVLYLDSTNKSIH